MDILVVQIAFGLRTVNLLVLLSQFRDLLAKLRVEVEESQFYMIVRVFGDFELMGDICGQLDREIQNADYTGVIHVCEVIWKLEHCWIQHACGSLHWHELNLRLFSTVDHRFLKVIHVATYLL